MPPRKPAPKLTLGTAPGTAAGRRRAPKAAERARAERVYAILAETYPDAHCALDHRNAFELLIATILSAQCTDVRVNLVTPALFAKYPTPRALADAEQADVEALVKTTGFFRNKAKSIRGAARAIVDAYGGEVPRTMAELLRLPGVARKTANVVLGNAFGVNEGVVVDTHVGRLSFRLAFTKHADPKKVELDLAALFPRERWTMLAHLLIFHGRKICVARKPRCEVCPVNALCPKAGVTLTAGGQERRGPRLRGRLPDPESSKTSRDTS